MVYETPIKDLFPLNDMVSGDLDNDGRKTSSFWDNQNHLPIWCCSAPNTSSCPAIAGSIRAEIISRSRRRHGRTARSALVADVTGDGKNDLIVVVHDRILAYPQE